MPCAYPRPGYRKIYKRGKVGEIYVKEPCMRPCGMCWQCRLEFARQWAMRCTHEAQLHEENCFITLTYNQEHLPKDKSVHKRALQLFFKRLRKHLEPKEIRYYACGEYGDRLGRPHYHACLFGHSFTDKTVIKGPRVRSIQNYFKTSNNSFSLYTSKTLERIWGKGFVTIGDLSFESAGYVARYCMKKITGPPASSHYKNKNPEFALMSRRPGIGFPWFEKFLNDVYPKDFTTINGKKMRPPRYYDYILEMRKPFLFEEIKEERRDNESKNLVDPKRRQQLNDIKRKQCKLLERKLEHEQN